MRNFLLKGITAVLFIVVFLCVSCKREVIQNESLTIDCRITRIVTKSQWTENKSGNFIYNSFGDPVSYTPDQNGALRYEFRYDREHRLTDYIGYHSSNGNGVFEFWTKYYYEKSKVVRDTTYHHGHYGDEPKNYSQVKEVTAYQYDAQDRISGAVYKQLHNGIANGIVGDYRYVYNENGNLVMPDAVYDNSVSIYRTSKIFMFVNRNYSKNNIRPAVAYNSKGLPVGFSNSTQYSLLSSLELSNCEIVYDCN